ncbi:hypothetical protein N7532_009436 [Penicillium argentinense]|uniref:Uncharacterized protein n=1 Tax=Penicillium argentinense TaxID=1131581 RepID=A0A9W9K3G6_9EURO|nr:uncharacterized protein N7532_009436 [Penicillium argentinense]KAJ5090752.1 hypothetical protein N7532_009436 [Penicillium argentinense]
MLVIPETTKSNDDDKTTETGYEQATGEMKDPIRREELMLRAVIAGTDKIYISKSTKVTMAMGNASDFLLRFKSVIDLVVKINL